jgi:toxin HigB-1
MINSFASRETYTLFRYRKFIRFKMIEIIALRKFDQIEAATTINDLKQPPGNKLEKLIGNRKGQYSIRINSQWRICFEWQDRAAENVEVTDYP